MNAHQIAAYLNTHAAKDVIDFGVVREDESVLAVGKKNPDGSKVRWGSVTDNDTNFVILQYPNSEEEYRAETLADVGWFLWKLAQVNGDFVAAEDWMRSR